MNVKFQWVWVVVFFASLLITTTVAADEKTTVSFVGFAQKGDHFAVAMNNEYSGANVLLYKVGELVPVAVVKTKDVAKALASDAVSAHAISTDRKGSATTGGTVTGKQLGMSYQLVSKGSDQTVLGLVPIATDSTGDQTATVTIKSVHWWEDGKKVVIILNQKLEGDWGVDTDLVVSYAVP